MKKLVYIACFCLPSFVALAQGDVTLYGTADREVEPAYRIALTPRVVDTTIPMTTVDYPLLALKYPTSTDLEKINPSMLKINPKLPKLYNTYVKLGIGSELMPLGEIYFDATRSRKYMYGAHLKHLSSFGNLPNYAPAQFDRTKFNLYGGVNQRRYTMRGDLHYNNQGLHHYGVRSFIADSLGLTKDSIAQRYNDFGFDLSFAHHKKDSGHLNLGIDFAYNWYASKKPDAAYNPDWRARENYFNLTPNGYYQMGIHLLEGALDIEHNSYKYGAFGVLDTSYVNSLDTAFARKNTIVRLLPSITSHSQDDRFKFKIGLDMTFDADDEKTRPRLYPIAEVKYSMFNDIFIPYAGIKGGLTQASLKRITNDNEFMLANVHMQNESRYDFYGGFKGTISKRIGFNIMGTYSSVKGLGMFVNDSTFSPGNKFDVLYDTAKVMVIEGSMYYQLKEKFKIDAIGRFNSYELNNNPYAWNRPALELILRGSYNLFDKFLFNLDGTLEHGRKALVYEAEDDVTLEDGILVKDLGFLADVNLGVEYRYNKRLSAFIQCNNIASQRYMRYHNTPVQPFQVMGGITARF